MIESPIIITALSILLLYCAYTDKKYEKIFNHATYPGILLGIFLNVFLYRLDGLYASFLGFIIVFIPFFLLFMFGAMGGGDVKLIGAIGALAGYPQAINLVLYSIIAGGLLAIILSIWRKTLLINLKNLGRFFLYFFMPNLKTQPIEKKDRNSLPFGLAVLLGNFLCMVDYHYKIVQFYPLFPG